MLARSPKELTSSEGMALTARVSVRVSVSMLSDEMNVEGTFSSHTVCQMPAMGASKLEIEKWAKQIAIANADNKTAQQNNLCSTQDVT